MSGSLAISRRLKIICFGGIFAIFCGYVGGLVKSGLIEHATHPSIVSDPSTGWLSTKKKQKPEVFEIGIGFSPKSTNIKSPAYLKSLAEAKKLREERKKKRKEERKKQSILRAAKRKKEGLERKRLRKKLENERRIASLKKLAEKKERLKNECLKITEELKKLVTNPKSLVDEMSIQKVNELNKKTLNLELPPTQSNPILKWYYNTMVNDYLRANEHDGSWDSLAIQALWLSGQQFAEKHCSNTLKIDSVSLHDKYKYLVDDLKCTNPIVHYGYFKIKERLKKHHSHIERSEEALAISDAVKKSRCSLFLKLTVNNDTIICFSKPCPEIHWKRRQKIIEFLMEDGKKLYHQFVENKEIPDSILAATMVLQSQLVGASQEVSGKSGLSSFLVNHSYPLSAVIKVKETCPGVLMLKADNLITQAWRLRGSGYAKSVSPHAFNGFRDNLAKAKTLLDEAHKLVPDFSYPSIKMITVSMGLGSTVDEMNLWFNRAIKTDPSYIPPYMAKFTFLLPKWYGSEEECLAFARETLKLAETRIEMAELAEIIQDAHFLTAKRRNSITPWSFSRYWRNPEVWADLVKSYEILSYPGQLERKRIESRFWAQKILCQQKPLSPMELAEARNKYDLNIFHKYRVSVPNKAHTITKKITAK